MVKSASIDVFLTIFKHPVFKLSPQAISFRLQQALHLSKQIRQGDVCTFVTGDPFWMVIDHFFKRCP